MKLQLLLLAFLVYGSAQCQQTKNNNDTAYTYRDPSPGGTGKFYLGREISQIMDASGADWLERTSRPEQENTSRIVESIKLSPTTIVADVGAGTGYYTFRIAPKVPQGKVFAVELQDELIDILNKKIRDSAIRNVEVIKADTFNTHLPVNKIDVAIMVDVYHELFYPREVLKSINAALKPDGKLILVEYRGEDPAIQIKPLHKTTFKQLSKELKANGFVVDRRVNNLPIQHFIVFRKKPASR